MKITQQSNFGNTPMFANITYRDVGVYMGTGGIGILLFFTPVFKYNWIAIVGYIALVSVLLGKTPTGRSMATNIYGIVFKKPIKMVVSSQATVNTIGHGIRHVEKEPDMDTYGIRLMSGNYAMVYVVTSGINNWSTVDDFHSQAINVKKLFNVMEGGEGLDVVVKHDSDTGMMALKESLDRTEKFEGDDLLAMSERRKSLLIAAGTSNIGRSVQQYLILKVKPKNIRRCHKALVGTARLIRPAEYPIDVLLATMGLEGGPKEGVDSNGEES